MSYVLEALRKAEMERELTRVPGIASSQPYTVGARRSHLRSVVLVVAAVSLGGGATWAWMHRDVLMPGAWGGGAIVAPARAADADRPASDPTVRENVFANERARAPGPQPPQGKPRAAVGMVQTDPVIAPEPQAEPAATSAPRTPSDPPTARGGTAAPAAAADDPAPAVAGEPGPAEPASPPATPSTRIQNERQALRVSMIEPADWEGTRHIAPPAQAADPEPEPPRPAMSEIAGQPETPDAVPDGPPFLQTLSYRFQSTVPELVINAQVYAASPEGRFVILNMKRYNEGQRTQEGVLVESIGPEALVLEYQGQRFRVRR